MHSIPDTEIQLWTENIRLGYSSPTVKFKHGVDKMNRILCKQKSFAHLVISTIVVIGCGGDDTAQQPDRVRSVNTMVISENLGTTTREFPGKVRASQSADLSFRISGPLIEFVATPGKQVSEGDVLAKIDPREFLSNMNSVESAFKEATAQLSAMQSGAREEDIKVLEAGVESATATLKEAEVQYSRLSGLLKEGVGTEANVDQQLKVRDVAKANLEKAEQSLKAAKAGARKEDIDAMEARIEGLTSQLREAKAKLDDAVLKAPFSGVVAKTFVENFEDVRAKQEVLSLQDDSSVEVEINISESAMARGNRKLTITELAESLDAQVAFTGVSNQKYGVKLKDYETEADPVTQTFAVTFSLNIPDGLNIRPGMNAVVSAKGQPAGAGIDSAITIPLSAIFADVRGNETVWKIDTSSMAVSPVSVETGAVSGDSIAIISGLEIGDMIATSAANSLREGMSVRSMDSKIGNAAE
jgi:membrane fusion protein, multidrug efflux system